MGATKEYAVELGQGGTPACRASLDLFGGRGIRTGLTDREHCHLINLHTFY
jgi:hypothetical protein